MILTAEQRMAAEMRLDVDNPLGRGSIKNKKWPGGVMVYVIDSSLCKYFSKCNFKRHMYIKTSLKIQSRQ